MIDSKALEHAAQRSYEYEGDRKGCSYVGWDREPEDVKAEWRASVRTAVLAYLSATSPAAEIAGTVGDANLKIGQTGVTQDGVEYVVVPKEPTEAMMDAADAAYDEFEKSVDGVWCGAAPTYRAMTTPSALSGGK